MQYTAIFHDCKNVNFQIKNSYFFHIFAQNIDCGYTLELSQFREFCLSEAVLTSTNNLRFEAKIRKVMYTPVNPIFLYKKWGVRGSSFHGHVCMMVLFETCLNQAVYL